MSQHAHVRVHGELRDLTPRDEWLTVRFDAGPSAKDAIESVGVPHPEIGRLTIGGDPAALDDRLHDGDRVEVWPIEPARLDDPRFVCDVHLGRLARHLRLLGFDTWYGNDAGDPELAHVASAERRALLTRDVGLLKRREVTVGRWVRATDPQQQVVEVARRFRLDARLSPFTRCLECNGSLEPVDKADVDDRLPPHVRASHELFTRCRGCDRVYWPGTHHDRLAALVDEIRRAIEPPLP